MEVLLDFCQSLQYSSVVINVLLRLVFGKCAGGLGFLPLLLNRGYFESLFENSVLFVQQLHHSLKRLFFTLKLLSLDSDVSCRGLHLPDFLIFSC